MPLRDEPDNKRRKLSGGSLDMSISDIESGGTSVSADPKSSTDDFEQCENTINGPEYVFRHNKDFDSCHWRQAANGDHFCCELEMDDETDHDFLDLAVIMHKQCPRDIKNADTVMYLNAMTEFYKLGTGQSTHTADGIYIFDYCTEALDLGVQLAKGIEWQNTDPTCWTGKRLFIVVSDALDEIDNDRLNSISELVSVLQSPFYTKIAIENMNILQNVVFPGFGNLTIDICSNLANVMAPKNNLLAALNRVEEILDKSKFSFERFFQINNYGGHSVELDDDLYNTLVNVAVYMQTNLLNARVEIKNFVFPEFQIFRFLRTVMAVSPEKDNSKIIDNAIVLERVTDANAENPEPNSGPIFFQIISNNDCTVLTSYPFLRLHIGELTG